MLSDRSSELLGDRSDDVFEVRVEEVRLLLILVQLQTRS